MADDNIGSISADLELDNTDWVEDLNVAASRTQKFAKQIQSIGGRMKKIGRNLMLTVSLPILLFGGTALKQFIDFEAAMLNVNTIAKQSQSQLKDTSKEVMLIANELGKAPTELAEALFFINSASFKGAEGLKVLRQATMAAVAGVTEVSTASQAITAILNAYGLAAEEAADVSDILFKTNELGVTTFEKLASHLGTTVATASAAKIPFEQVAAAIATMTRGGISTSEAFVGMNRFILRLIQGTDELNSGFQRLTGTTAADIIQTKGLGAAVKVLSNLTGGSTEKMLKLGFRLRDLKAALSLTRDGMKPFLGDLEAIANKGNRAGSTAAALATQMTGLGFQVKRMASLFKSLQIVIGEDLGPVVQPIVYQFQRLFKWFQQLSPTTRKVIEVIAALVATIGPLLFALGTLVSMVGFIAAGWPAIVTVVGAILGTLSAIIPVVLAIVAALAALGFAFIQATGDGDTFGERTSSSIAKVKGWLVDLVEWAQFNGPRIWNHITAGIEMIAIEAEFAVKQVLLVFDVMAENILTAMFGMANNVSRIWQWLGDNWVALTNNFLTILGAFVTEAVDLYKGLSEMASDWLANIWTTEGNEVVVEDRLKNIGKKFAKTMSSLNIPLPGIDDWSDQYRDWVNESLALDKDREKAIQDSLNNPLGAATAAAGDLAKKLTDGTGGAKNDIKAIIGMARIGAAALERGTQAASKAITTGLRAEDISTVGGAETPISPEVQQQMEITNDQQMTQSNELSKINQNTKTAADLQRQAVEQRDEMVEVLRKPQFEVVVLT